MRVSGDTFGDGLHRRFETLGWAFMVSHESLQGLNRRLVNERKGKGGKNRKEKEVREWVDSVMYNEEYL